MNIFEAADYAAIFSHAIPFAIVVGGYLSWALFGGNDNTENVYLKHYNFTPEELEDLMKPKEAEQ